MMENFLSREASKKNKRINSVLVREDLYLQSRIVTRLAVSKGRGLFGIGGFATSSPLGVLGLAWRMSRIAGFAYDDRL